MSFSATSAIEKIHLEGMRVHSCIGHSALDLEMANRQIYYCRGSSRIFTLGMKELLETSPVELSWTKTFQLIHSSTLL